MNILDPMKWSEKVPFMGIMIPRGVFYFVGGIVSLTILVWVTGFAFRAGNGNFAFNDLGVSRGGMPGWGGGTTGGWADGESSVAPSPPMMDAGYAEEYARNVKGVPTASYPYPYPSPGGYATGDDAESFEVKTYNARIETPESDTVCQEFAALKSRADVIFSYANEHDDGCEYTFKTPKDKAGEIVALIERHDPKTLQGQTETIKPRLDNITSEEEILKQRLASIDATLLTAEQTYDEMAELAASTRDADALARVIASKLQFIQQMTNERLAINDALSRLSKTKADESDRLLYAFFTVQVFEKKIVDGESVRDEWMRNARLFITEGNSLLIGLSLGLLLNLLVGITFAVYLLIILVVAKYGWRFIKNFWSRP